jgi:hypothetical protein
MATWGPEWDLISLRSESDWAGSDESDNRSISGTTLSIGADEEDIPDLQRLENWFESDGETSIFDDEDGDGEEQEEVDHEEGEEVEEEQEEEGKDEEKPQKDADYLLESEVAGAPSSSNTDKKTMETLANDRTSTTIHKMQSLETASLHAKDTSPTQIDFWDPFISAKEAILNQRTQSTQVDHCIRFIEQSVIPVLNILQPPTIHKEYRLMLATLLENLVSSFMSKNVIAGVPNSEKLATLLDVISEEVAAVRIRIYEEREREKQAVRSSIWDHRVPSFGIQPIPDGRGDSMHSLKADMDMPPCGPTRVWPRDHRFLNHNLRFPTDEAIPSRPDDLLRKISGEQPWKRYANSSRANHYEHLCLFGPSYSDTHILDLDYEGAEKGAPSDIRRHPLERMGPYTASAVERTIPPTSVDISEGQIPELALTWNLMFDGNGMTGVGTKPREKSGICLDNGVRKSGSLPDIAGEWEEVEEYLRQRYSAPRLEDPLPSRAKF